ncbi:ATP-dependent DNA ligase [Pseudalkalibacillus salsuginis]|uniref:ATP-dependent DNA ligase n=1 Tax=Pseudalkalibacillus salsuginis TaxID=2910972 RepID=UPI002AFF6D26|nr:ATP-dependent DNA ligase [Pseudalkalibacillus salsuginis]
MYITPMLLQTSKKAFNDPDYIYEMKLDGFRGIFSQMNGTTTLYTRHNNIVTDRFPEFLNVPIKEDIVLDGEVVCFNPLTKQVDFEGVMERFLTKNKQRITQRAIAQPVNYVVFDILFYKGKDLRNLPLMERKAILDEVIKDNQTFSKIRYIEGDGESYFEVIKKANIEGMVAKYKNSVYQPIRSSHWLKVINWQYTDVFITGYKKDQTGWLASIEEGHRMKPVGVIEYGASPNERKAFYHVSKSLITHEDRQRVYLDPAIRAKK